MSVTQTISSGRPVADFPSSPDGEPFRYALVRGEVTTFADSLTDLVGVVLPGYAALSDDAALLARWQCAAKTATEIQQMIAAAAGLDPSRESEDVLTAIFHDRAEPLPDVVPAAGWDHPVRLILLATDYAPFTDSPAPTGNVELVDPSTEREFLTGLASLGVVQLYSRNEDLGAV